MFGATQLASFGPGPFGSGYPGGAPWFGPASFSEPRGKEGPGCAAGAGGFGFPGTSGGGLGAGPGGFLMKATAVAALLLDGPADAAGVVARIAAASGGAVAPPAERAELMLALMAGRGVVSLDNGEATLTELGRNLLALRGVNADTARAMLAQAAKFSDVVKIHRELKATGQLARTIAQTGTAAQKQTLNEARAAILTAITEAKRTLHESLATGGGEQPEPGDTAELSAAELAQLRSILAKLTR